MAYDAAQPLRFASPSVEAELSRIDQQMAELFASHGVKTMPLPQGPWLGLVDSVSAAHRDQLRFGEDR